MPAQRVVECLFQSVDGHDGPEVDQGPRRRRRGDPIDGHDVREGEVADAMSEDAALTDSPCEWQADLDDVDGDPGEPP